MVLTRYPNLLTEKLRKIITRDSIIIISIVAPVAGLFDVVFDPLLTSTEKIIAYVMIAAFIMTGLIRLKRGSILDKKPILSIIIYQVILFVVVSYLSDVRGFYIFFWMIPIFLSSFYYGKKVVIVSFLVLAVAQTTKIVYFTLDGYISSTEDYLHMIIEYFVVVAMSLLIIDSISVTEEDRKLLLQSLKKAEAEEQQVSVIMNSMADAVIAIDMKGRITANNPAALEMFNAHDTLVEKQLGMIVSALAPDQQSSFADYAISSKQSKKVAIKLANSDEGAADIEVTIAPLHEQEQGVEQIGFILVFRDITSDKALQAERNNFVSLLSHELRTPLATAEALLSNAEFFFEKQASIEQIHDAVSKVRSEVVNIMHITNDLELLLDVTSETEETIMSQINLDELLSELKSKHEQQAKKKGLEFAIVKPENTPNSILSSKQHLLAILGALISNGIKYTTQGSVTLNISLSDSGIDFSVTDTGSGIDESDFSKIFKPFMQADTYTTREQGGIGVGLFIARRLSNLLEGNITVRSELGKGSTFTLKVPLIEMTGMISSMPKQPEEERIVNIPDAAPTVANPLAS